MVAITDRPLAGMVARLKSVPRPSAPCPDGNYYLRLDRQDEAFPSIVLVNGDLLLLDFLPTSFDLFGTIEPTMVRFALAHGRA